MSYNPNNPNGQAVSSASAPVVLASDQSEIPVSTSNPQIFALPTSNSMAALNASVVYQVESGANLYLTLTNGPGATSAWSGTVSFQYSTNGGSSYSALTVLPVASPANSATTTSSTVNGLWIAEVPAGVNSEVVYIRATMSSYTSGTAYFFAAVTAPYQKILLPWTYTVTSAATLMGPIEASNFNAIDVQISAITTTVYTMQGTNDPTLTTWSTLPVISVGTQAASAATMSAALTYRCMVAGYKWIRIQCTTTGTVATIQGISGTLGQTIILTVYGNDIGFTVNSGTVTTVSTVSSVTAVAAINSVATTNGLSIGTVVTTATPAVTTIKANAGRLHFLQIGNPNSSAVYAKMFNATSATLGTTSANFNFLIPANSSISVQINDVGIYFSTGILIAVTGGESLTDNTAITTGAAVNYSYI